MTVANVTNVTSHKADATYGVSEDIYVEVTFDQDVVVTGTPQLLMDVNTPGFNADYVEPLVLNIQSDNAGTSNSDQVTLPLFGTQTYDFLAIYDGQVTHHTASTDLTLTFPSGAGNYDVSIVGQFAGLTFNNGGDKLKLLDVSQWGDCQWKVLTGAFYGCSNLTVSATDYFNIEAVQYANAAFKDCTSMTSLYTNDWQTGSIIDFTNMFSDCTGLTSLVLTDWNFSAGTQLAGFIEGCTALTSIGSSTNWNFSNMLTMQSAFAQTTSLVTLDASNWDVSKVTNFVATFWYCDVAVLDVSSWVTTSATNFAQTFRRCSNVTTLDVSGFDMSSVTDASLMFEFATGITSLDLSSWDVSSITTFSAFCRATVSLTTIGDTSSWVTSSMTNTVNMFRDAGITSITGVGGWDITGLTNATDMFRNCTLTTVNYDSLLTGWEGQTELTSVVFNGGSSLYSAGAPTTARGVLVSTSSWTITDGGPAP